MYEIYINDRPLRLIQTNKVAMSTSSDSTHLFARYTGKAKTLLHYADLLEKGSPKVAGVTLTYPDLNQLWNDFLSHYDIVPAAGGLVRLEETDKYLFIFRRGYLDLPKGKIDNGETPEEAALREVEEETGLTQLKWQEAPPALHMTYHTYRSAKKKKRILKPTYWYKMQGTAQELIPQLEEDIEWARWLSPSEICGLDLTFYSSLQKLIEEALL